MTGRSAVFIIKTVSGPGRAKREGLVLRDGPSLSDPVKAAALREPAALAENGRERQNSRRKKKAPENAPHGLFCAGRTDTPCRARLGPGEKAFKITVGRKRK